MAEVIDRHELWASLDMDLETHDQLCVVLPQAFGDVFLSQKNRPEGMYQALANRYMQINCACFTPNKARIDEVIQLARDYQVDGVINTNLKFCTTFKTEAPALEAALEEAGIPVLDIETDYTDNDAEQLRTRVGAFIEMLG